MIKLLFVSTFVLLLSGCSNFFETEDERLSRCEKKGISRDVCYQQDREDARAALNRQPRVTSKYRKEMLESIGLEEK